MKDFLVNKNNVTVSTYITNNPYTLGTNGALTIVDNTPDGNNTLPGLVPNSYSIFLDGLFITNGYGFASYSEFENASYLVSTYTGTYWGIINEIKSLRNQSFKLEYTYINNENILDRQYNSYGWLTSYKQINLNEIEDPSYVTHYKLHLEKINTNYINNIELSIQNGKSIDGTSEGNYFDVNSNDISAILEIKLSKNRPSSDIDNFKETGPSIYLNGELLNLNTGENGQNNLIISRNYESSRPANKDINLQFVKDNLVIYTYNIPNAIKWRHKILPFNTENVNIFHGSGIGIENFYEIDKYEFSDNTFNIDNEMASQEFQNFINFIDNNLDNAWYLDDEVEISFSGNGYVYNGVNYYMHDYIVIKSNVMNFDFYFNNIKNNNWNYIEFNLNGEIYRLYQSPQRYIGQHKWTIKYRYE